MDHITSILQVEDSANLNNIVYPAQSATTSLNGTLTLVATGATAVLLTGTATGYSVVLPVATTLLQGRKYEIYNTTAQVILIKTNGGATLFTLDQNSTAHVYLQSNGTAAGTWLAWQAVSNPSIASGIINYKITSSTTFTTSSTTDVVITSFTITPIAGLYAVWFNSACSIANNNTLLAASVYKNGSIITDSSRVSQASGGTWTGASTSITASTFNGTDTCDVRVKQTGGGNISILDRTLIMIRLGS